jgi:Galactose oxidase-like, Early set domain/Carboxypeptidase regulatory-like domain
MPDGRVFFVSYYAESLQPHLWDPGSNTFTTTAASAYALFCAGHTTLSDGRVLIAGGHVADYVGYPHAIIYNPASNGFTSLPDMNAARWYPTVTTLPNGDVLVVSGDINSNTNVDPLPQVFQFASHAWRNLTTAQLALPLYPNMLVAPNGKVFNAGPSRQTRYLNTSGTGAWSNVAILNFTGFRDYGPAVMYDSGKVLVAGGADPPTATAEVIDLNAATPAWKFTGSMHFPRRQHNAVILPDGKVLIVGGSRAGGFDTSTSPVLPTEMWNPATGQFTVMASIATYRGYHSTALLLPDGRVLSAGGNVGGPNAQLFSPPYLFAGARPAIASAPTSAGYGQTVFIGSPDAASVSKVTLLRDASVTHTNNMSQGFSSLSFTKTSTGLNVVMPANANLAPPGYYMLFILNSAGVPSVGSIIQLLSSAAPTGTVTGKVTNTQGVPISGASVSSGGTGATTTNASGSYTLTGVPVGTVQLVASAAGFQSATQNVSVSNGVTATANFTLTAGAAGGTVTGKITNASSGAILPGATVSWSGGTTSANASGIYTLTNVTAGSQKVTAGKTGYLPHTIAVTVTGGATSALNIPIATAGKITVKVVAASGAVFSGAAVTIKGGVIANTVTGSTSTAGLFTTNFIPVGTYTVTISKTGHTTQSKTTTVTSGVTTSLTFTKF